MKFNSADKEVVAIKTRFWKVINRLAKTCPSMSFLSCVITWRDNIPNLPLTDADKEVTNYASYLLEANPGIGVYPVHNLPYIRIIT